MLDEFQFAIKHFVPTVPPEVKEEAQKIHDQLVGNEATDEMAIKKAFYEVGVKEYPHRRAYTELTHSTAESQMKQMVLEHVDEAVRAVIEPFLNDGVGLEELVSSEIFTEKLDGTQRYQVEDGILVAKDKLAEVLKANVGDQAEHYNTLLEKWTNTANELVAQIDKLELFIQGGDESQQQEIKNKVARFREGFLITEPDPEMEEIKKEIEYWTDTFAEEE